MIVNLLSRIYKILDECFAQLSKVEEVCIDQDFIKKHSGYIQAWKVTTTISIREAVAEDISFVLAFKSTFPYSLPNVYYFDTKYDYFPHIDYNNRKLCLFDNSIIINTEEPYELIRTVLKRSKFVVKNGTRDDFHKEIINYWDLQYLNERPIQYGWLHSISSFEKSRYLKLYASDYLEQNRCNACIVEVNSDLEYIKYFKQQFGKQLIEHNVLFLANVDIPLTPPYAITTEIFQSWITSDDDVKMFHHYIRTQPGLLIVVFRLGSTNLLGGFIYEDIKIKRRGFRDGKLTRHNVITKLEKNKLLHRLLIYEYSDQRIAMRTKGEAFKPHRFVVAGLGSIGSQLCHFLNSLNSPKMLLVDNDVFNINNIGRHLLGFNFLNQPKVDAVKGFLKALNPNQDITTYRGDIESCLLDNLAEINQYDLLIICTGNIMSELFALHYFESKQLNIPLLLIWLEPYALAGHMMYIKEHIDDSIKERIFSESYLYKYNIIDEDEYSQKSFTVSDAGCNGEYTLYSGNDVMLFLSAMFPIIDRIIRHKKSSGNMCYRWIGDISIAKDKNIRLKNIEFTPYGVEELAI